jgi:hypothetical protein
MNYTFKIGDLSLTHLFKPDVSNITLQRQKQGDDQFGRLEISGTFKFVGDDYDRIIDFIDTWGHNELGMLVYQNGTLLGLTTFNTKQIIDRSRSQYIFNVKVLDEYENFVSKGDLQYNILNTPYTSRSLKITTSAIREVVTKTIFNRSVAGVFDVPTATVEVNLNILGLYYSFEIGDSYTNWTMIYNNYTHTGASGLNIFINGTAEFVSEKIYGSYNGGDAQPPTGSGWVYVKDEQFGNITAPLYRRPIQEIDVITSTNTFTNYGGVDYRLFNYRNSNAIDLSFITITYQKITRRVDNIIEYIVGEINSSIQFDSTGTINDSFYSFKTWIGDIDNTANIYDTNKTFNNFLICQLTDIIPDSSVDPPIQKSDPATLGLLSFNDLMEWLKTYGFYWYLENRSGTYYFRILHKKDIELLDLNPDLRNWFGYNYTNLLPPIEYDKGEYSRLVNKQKTTNFELKGVDILFYLVQEDKNKDISSSIFYTDLTDIINNGEDDYDTSATDKFVLITALIDDSNYYHPRKINSLLVEDSKIPNGELGWSYVSAELISDLPDERAIINGTSQTLPDYRVKRRAKLELKIPINGINDFNLSGYVNINYNQMEIESFSQEAEKNTGKLNLRSL